MTNRPIEIYRNDESPDLSNIRKVALEGVLLPWWDPSYGARFPHERIGALILAFRDRFGQSLLVQFYAANDERERVRFLVIPSESSTGKSMMSTGKISDMSHFIVGFQAAVESEP